MREWKFDRSKGKWTVNGVSYDENPGPRAFIGKGTGEIWILRNNSNGWMHPMQIHFEEFHILYRGNGFKPGPFSPAIGRGEPAPRIYPHVRHKTRKPGKPPLPPNRSAGGRPLGVCPLVSRP